MSEDRCFCHFNGFAVKDATARRAISTEVEAREQAISAEAAAREQAIRAEAETREQAIRAEAETREQAIRAEAAAREQAISAEAAAREQAISAEVNALKQMIRVNAEADEHIVSQMEGFKETIKNLESQEAKVETMVDHIVEYWEDKEFRHFIRKYDNGTAEAIFQSIWTDLSFTTEHNGFYAHDVGRVRVGLEEILQGVVPEYCSIYVTKVTKTNENGEETFGPPVFGMVCGTPEYLADYGVVSPRILFLADEMAQNVTLELELQCRWKWKKQEEAE